MFAECGVSAHSVREVLAVEWHNLRAFSCAVAPLLLCRTC